MVALVLLAGCSLRATMSRSLQRTARHAGLEAADLHTADFDLHYLRSTDPPAAARPLLVLHGFGGDALSNWAAQLDTLAPVRPLLLPDLLWFGQSTAHVRPTLDAQAEAMLALLDAESVPAVDILAISYGGFVAFGMVERAPDRVGRLILVDTPGPLFSSADVQDLVDRHGVDRPEDLFLAETPEDLGALLTAVLHEPPHIPGPFLRAMHAQWFAVDHEPQRALLADLPRQRMLLEHLRLDPTEVPLVIWGAHDQIFPLAAGEALAEAIDGHLVVLHGAAHAPNIEQRGAFNATLRAYLEAPAPAPGRTDLHPR